MSAATPPLPKSVVLARGAEHLPCGAPAIRTDARVSFVLLYDLARSESLFAPERLPDGTGRAASA